LNWTSTIYPKQHIFWLGQNLPKTTIIFLVGFFKKKKKQYQLGTKISTKATQKSFFVRKISTNVTQKSNTKKKQMWERKLPQKADKKIFLGGEYPRKLPKKSNAKKKLGRKLLRKSNTKTKFFGGNFYEKCTFWKKKHFLIFARFLLKKNKKAIVKGGLAVRHHQSFGVKKKVSVFAGGGGGKFDHFLNDEVKKRKTKTIYLLILMKLHAKQYSGIENRILYVHLVVSCAFPLNLHVVLKIRQNLNTFLPIYQAVLKS
jgi:hypothetical protein